MGVITNEQFYKQQLYKFRKCVNLATTLQMQTNIFRHDLLSKNLTREVGLELSSRFDKIGLVFLGIFMIQIDNFPDFCRVFSVFFCFFCLSFQIELPTQCTINSKKTN